MDQCYISTGALRSTYVGEIIRQLAKAGYKKIELTAGTDYYEDCLAELKALKQQYSLTLACHNYFPVPATPFVFNLASLDEEVGELSFNHALKAIDWTVALNTRVYSFHAGYLVDPQVNELGQKINLRRLYNRSEALDVFLERVNKLAQIGKERGIELLIENNVLSPKNYQEFQANPLLMVDEEETLSIMTQTPSNVNALIDVAHLKVSAQTLKFDPAHYLQACDNWIRAYHLSDNDGTIDNNQKITNAAWFWPYLKKNLNYYSIEVYNLSLQEIRDQNILFNQKMTS